MKILRKMITLLLMLLWLSALTLPVAASTYTEYDGLAVTVEMDQEEYEDGDPITATITVKNTKSSSVTIVNLEQLIPDGYVLAEDSVASMTNFTIKPGETVVLEVTFEGQPEEQLEGETESESFVDKLLYGYTLGIPNLLLALILVVALVIFIILT